LIVIDASAVIEILLNTPAAKTVAARVLDPSQSVAAPHLLDVEVLQVLRRYTRAGELDSHRGQQAIQDLLDLPIVRYPHDPLLHRVWELRDNVTAYDAVYIALAEALDAPLLTCDERLAVAPGHDADIQIA
jgi:predicted nucleic acid-binding protein